MAVVRMYLAQRRHLAGRDAGSIAEARCTHSAFTGLIVGKAPEMRQFLREQVCEPAARGSQWFEAPDVTSAKQVLGKVDVAIVTAEPATIQGEIALLGGVVRASSTISGPPTVVIGEHDDPDRIQQILDVGGECYVATRPPRHIWASQLRAVIADLFERHGSLKNTPLAAKQDDSAP